VHKTKGRKEKDTPVGIKVRVQTWFCGGGEARYWRVEENDDGTRETPAVHNRTDMAEAVHGESDGIGGDAVITITRQGESVDTPEEDAVTAAVTAIDSDDEVLVPGVKGAGMSEGVSVELVEVPQKATAAVIVIDSDDEVAEKERTHPSSRG
jgi:hypothetical protein